MDLKEIKKITAFARKSGIKSLKFDGFEVEFHDAALFPNPIKRKKLEAVQSEPDKAPNVAPTLDDINEFIYKPDDLEAS